MALKDKQIWKREVNASNEEPTSWKLNLFTEFDTNPEQKAIRCGSVVWLHHGEANAILTAVRRNRGVDKYNFSSLNLEQWLAKNNLELSVEQSATTDGFSSYSGNTFGMFVIEGENQQEGGEVEFKVHLFFFLLISTDILS